MGAIQIAGIAEGLAIAEQAGLDIKLVLEAIESGVAASPQVIRHSKRMAARNFDGATFTASRSRALPLLQLRRRNVVALTAHIREQPMGTHVSWDGGHMWC